MLPVDVGDRCAKARGPGILSRGSPPQPRSSKDSALLIPVRFIGAFTAASFAISLLSWSQGIGLGQLPSAAPAIIVHMVFHAVYGAVAAVPTRRRETIIGMALAAMAIDVDHLANYLGWPVPLRASHSLLFLVMAPALMALAARLGLLGRDTSPRLAASMALATVMAHLAWDAVTAGETRIPFWLPFSTRTASFPASIGAMLEVGAATVMWWAVSGQGIRARWRLPGGRPAQS